MLKSSKSFIEKDDFNIHNELKAMDQDVPDFAHSYKNNSNAQSMKVKRMR